MAVVQWNQDKNRIQVNTHYMSGKPRELPFDDTYSQPVSEIKTEFIRTVLRSVYPGHKIEVLGAPWDYNQSTQPELNKDKPIGHYRVKIKDMPEVIACVNLFDGEEAITLGGQVFGTYQNRGMKVAGPVMLPDEKWTISKDGYHVHLEHFTPSAKALSSPGVTINGKEKEIGRMVGRIYAAGVTLPDKTISRLKTFTDDVTIRSWQAGFDIFNGQNNEVIEHLQSLASQSSAQIKQSPRKLTSLFSTAIRMIQDRAPQIIQSQERISTTFNFIDKMVKTGPDGNLVFCSYDTISRGYVAMPTENSTHDVGFAVGRIILKPELYSGADKKAEIQNGLSEFTKGFNEESLLRISPEEALESAETVTVLNLLFGIGYNKLAEGHTATSQDMADHIAMQVVPQLNSIKQAINNLKL